MTASKKQQEPVEPEKLTCAGCGQLVVPRRHCLVCHDHLEPTDGLIRCGYCGRVYYAAESI